MRILQVFRAPFGGLFRHVCDLVKAQSALGHEVGMICDSSTGGKDAEITLKAMQQYCSLGVKRIEMSRLPGLGDAISARRVAEFARTLNPDIMHGHGAKGGAYVRIAGFTSGAKTIYTPHGGSLHYNWNSPSGAIFLGAERMLLARTNGLVFVCDYEKRTFEEKIGGSSVASCVVHNGLWPDEFEAAQVKADASDILYIGELRQLKGVDVLINAIKQLGDEGKKLSATIVGYGKDRESLEAMVKSLGLADRIKFAGAMKASDAFKLGRIMVVPSRAESFPYIVLESIAAHKPLIATRVGGIPEVLGDEALVNPDNIDELAGAIASIIDNPERAQTAANERASYLRDHANANNMGNAICDFYQLCLGKNTGQNAAA